jgi:pyrimidine operon attenuation protein/uracil phosphoribosyltransferase
MKVIFGEDVIEKFISESAEIIGQEEGEKCIIGIKTGGFILAKRIHNILQKESKDVKIGSVDITFWRDDLSRNPYPIVKGSEINFSTDDLIVFLIDDVIYTGRTIRAALCEIFEFGRPKMVKLFTLVNRVGREMPIHPDFFSLHIKVDESESIEILLREMGFEKDIGVVIKKGEKIKRG